MTDVPHGRRRLAIASAAAVIFAGSILGYAWLDMHFPREYFALEDLRIYQLGGKQALHDGPLYTKAFPRSLPFLYPPFAALLFATVAPVTFAHLKVLMTAANILALIGSTWLAFGLAGTRDRWPRFSGTLFVSALAMWLDPVAQTLSFGQINLLLMLLVLADLSAGRRKGAGIGIAAGIKLTPGIFAVYLLITRRLRAFGMAVAAIAVTVGISFFFLPKQSAQYWLDRKFDSTAHLGSNYAGNQSMYAMIERLTHKGPHLHTIWLAAVVLVAAGGLLLALWAHRRGDELLAICLCAVTGLLVSPISWNHHWVWAVPVLVWALARLPRDLPRRWRPFALLVFAAVFAVFMAVPKHKPGTHSMLAHVTGWIWFMPVQGNSGYYWTGTQIIVGNLYVVFGLAFLLAVLGYLLATRSTPETAPPAPAEELTPAKPAA